MQHQESTKQYTINQKGKKQGICIPTMTSLYNRSRSIYYYDHYKRIHSDQILNTTENKE